METHCYDVDGNWFIKKPTIHPLEELSDVKSRELLRKRLIRNVDNLVNDAEKTTLAENMLCKCGGVPLAIIALASLLIRDQSIHMWRKFDQDALWMEKEDESGILPSLKLSFNYLPSSSLKACFAFCGIFEEDEVIIKDKLMCMWMAHGWLQSDNDEDEIMELKGEEYCKVLLNSSLLQEATKDRYGNVETFKMHDLVWSLARVVSKGECLCSNGEYDGSSQVRHLSLPGSTQELTLTSNTKLQTFRLYEARSLKFLKQCKHLRVLSIERIRDENWKWSMVESLKHLRYLSLDVNDFIEYWNRKQRSVSKPYHLQTLCIMGFLNSYNMSVPRLFANLFRNGIDNMAKLRHIHRDGHFGIPNGLGSLTALQTLPVIDLNEDWGGNISELGLLNNLRGKLGFYNLDWIKGKEDASRIYLGGKKHLETVELNFDGGICSLGGERPHQNEVLEAMQPHSNVKNLRINGYRGTRFPTWLIEKGNLVSLQLVFCKHVVGDLEMENFKDLRFLEIHACGQLSITFPNNGFQCCKLLEHMHLSSYFVPRNGLQEWFPKDLSPLTKIRYLRIEWGLRTIELKGLGALPCLTELVTDQLLPADIDQGSPLCNSLQILTLRTFPFSVQQPIIPFQLQYLVALQRLTLNGFGVETIPEWLENLKSLSFLQFSYMMNLKHLPSRYAIAKLSNLHTLHFDHCSVHLKKQIENEEGDEWKKIEHIANVKVD